MTPIEQLLAIMTDRYRICVTHVAGPNTTHGWFATKEDAEDFAMKNRVRLGLDRCLEWHIEHGDA